MTRTQFTTAAALLVLATGVSAQDAAYIRAVEAAQKERPAQLAPTGRIAAEGEPGSPLAIHGRAVGEDGTTPLPNVVVFAYQTDQGGLYDRAGSPPHSWRLKGWARTDSTGRFEFRTIRPGSYPGTSNPPHIHFTMFTEDGGRYHAGELQLTPQTRTRREAGVEHVEHTLRKNPRQRF